MSAILKVTTKWTGMTGGPGYTVMHWRVGEDGLGNEAAVNSVLTGTRAFFNALGQFVPNTATMQVESQVEELLVETGELVGFYNGNAVTPVVGSVGASTTYAAPVGAVVSWYTNGIRKGRRVRGRNFLVPVAGNAFASDGTLSTVFLTTMNSAADSLIAGFTSAALHVYARPTAKGASDGVAFPVASYRIPDMASVLRSRRD